MGKTDKRRSEGERTKRVSRWDYVFMNVPRPIAEMGAVPGIFSRPPSMACPRLVKSGSYWMDTRTHTHTHRASSLAALIGLNWKSCWVTVALWHTSAALVNWGCISMWAFESTWRASDWVCASSKCVSIFISVGPGITGRGVYGHVGIGCAPALIYSMWRTASDASGADTLNYIKMSVKTILILDVKVLQKDSRAYLRGGDWPGAWLELISS